MINIYAKKLEQIVTEMGGTLHSGTNVVTDSEYRQWLAFLKQVYPESELLRMTQPIPRVPTSRIAATDELKIYEDIHEIMMVAEVQGYPTWYIQPHYMGLEVALQYEQGTLVAIAAQSTGSLEIAAVNDIPLSIPNFTGAIHGTLCLSRKEYIRQGAIDTVTAQVLVLQNYTNRSTDLFFKATDIATGEGFIEKQHQLEQLGFTTTEYVLFPTSRLSTISSSKLETFFNSYIGKAYDDNTWVDGLVIISDTPLSIDDGLSSTRVLYKSSLEPPAKLI